MKLGDVLDKMLEEWLESPEHGQKIQELWGVDGYVCVCNFVEYVKDKENDRESDATDSDGY